MSENTPEINFSVAGLTEPLRFLSVDELAEWLTQEDTFWNWLQAAVQKDQNLHPLWSDISSGWTQIRQAISQYKSNNDVKQKARIVEGINSSLSALYHTNSKALPSSTAQAQFVERLRKTQPHIAAFVLQSFLKKHKQSIPHGGAVMGIVLASLFEHGLLKEASDAHVAALTAASDKWNQFQAEANQKHEDDIKAFESLKQEMEIWRVEKQTTYDQMGDAAQKEFERIAKKGQEDFTLIQNTYNEQLGLQAPVQYWEARAHSY